MATFGSKLKDLRCGKNMSREQLFAVSGVNTRAIRTYEDEKRAPSAENLFKLSKALGVDCSAFKDCKFDYESQEPKTKAMPRKKK